MCECGICNLFRLEGLIDPIPYVTPLQGAEVDVVEVPEGVPVHVGVATTVAHGVQVLA